MQFVDVIARKRDGKALSRDAIDQFVEGVVGGKIPDYQASALLMAIVLRGMTDDETAWLTDGIKVGKHSTGGVGDKVSIVLAPVAAACGVTVPKMSGRGLGHTGGTLDKLESIPGFRIGLSVDEFKRNLRDIGACIIGQTATLVPADKLLYALRDVTATVESIPLIASSIMSKKLAEGSNALILDVKCGDGAFMKDPAQARALAEAMVAIGTRAGVRTEAFLTDMDAPLGRTIGNTLEIEECIDTLKHKGPDDLTEVVVRLAGRMTILAGLERDADAARARASEALTSGAALQVFARMIERQGGNPGVVDDYALMPQAPDLQPLDAWRDGFVARLAAGAVGRASQALGAGRTTVGEPVDHAVGVRLQVQRGDRVSAGQPLLAFHHRGGRGLEAAQALCRNGIDISDEPLAGATGERILGEVR